MGGNAYREGRRQVNVLLPLALHGRVKAAAALRGLSVQEFAEEVFRDAVGGSGWRVGCAVAPDGGGPEPVVRGGGSDHVGVGSGDVARPLTILDDLPGVLSEPERGRIREWREGVTSTDPLSDFEVMIRTPPKWAESILGQQPTPETVPSSEPSLSSVSVDPLEEIA